MNRPLRIGTRGSQLALWQANEVARRLSEEGYRPEIVPYKTTADKRQDVPLAAIGGKGLWVKELEEALLRGDIDVAVHSLKDVPSIIGDDFVLAGFLERADPRDAWVNLESTPIAELHDGAVVGTSAPRRRAQLRSLFPKLRIDDIRGNVDTRINKLRAGLYDGAILAGAGLTRLGRSSEITSYFSIAEMLPACGQGIIAIETRRDGDTRAIAASISHPPTARAAYCERGVLQKFGTLLDCYSACAVHAMFDGGRVTLRAFFGEIEGDRSVRVACSGREADEVIDEVYRDLVDGGAMELLVPRVIPSVSEGPGREGERN
jgi:hydroxymethylbilane synthase